MFLQIYLNIPFNITIIYCFHIYFFIQYFLFFLTYILLGDKMIINYLKNIGYTLLIIITSCIIITILNYFNILNGNILNIISIIVILLSLFVGGFFTGRTANKKGYLEGIKIGGIMIVIVLLLNLLVFKNKFSLINILYYLSLLLMSTIGSMLGIQKRKI